MNVKQRIFAISLCSLVFSVLLILIGTSANAQIATLTQNDLGSTGATGSYSYNSGSYTIAGAGAGVGGPSDSFTFVNAAASGNIELVTRVASQTNTNSYATAGLMMKDALTAGGAQVSVAISPTNGVIFNSRASDGATTVTTLGPSVAAPGYLRLVRSGNSFAGYYGTDGLNWQLVNVTTIPTFPTSYYMGFAVSSDVYGTNSTAVFDSATYFTHVPQRSDTTNMVGWLRSDLGVTTSSSKISLWADQSIYGAGAYQSTSGNQPGYVTSAIQGLPAATFNGSTQFFSLNPWSDVTFGGGGSFFVVVKPTGTPNTLNYYFDMGNGAAANNIAAATPSSSSTAVNYYCYNGSSPSSIQSASGITQNSYQLLEIGESYTGAASIWTSSVLGASGTVNVFDGTTSRKQSYIGQESGGGNYFQGQIAEVIFFSTLLTSTQQSSLESYISSKYGVAVGGHAIRLRRADEPLIGSALRKPTKLKPFRVLPNWQAMAMEARVEIPTVISKHGSEKQKPDFHSKRLIAQVVTAPTISPLTGSFNTSQTVTMTAPAGNIYYTLDGTQPTNLSTQYTASFALNKATQVNAVAYSGGVYSAVTTVYLEIDPNIAPMLQGKMLLWLRSDFGVVTSGSSVTRWVDLSGSGNDATQSGGTHQPSIVNNAINGFPAVQFTPGSSGQYLQLPSGFPFNIAGQAAAGQILVIARPSAVTAGARIIDLGNGATSDNVYVSEPSSTGLAMYVYNGSTSSNVSTSTGVNLNQDQFLEAADDPYHGGSLFTNTIHQVYQQPLNSITQITRANNYIGQGSGGGNYFQGQIAEIAVFNNYYNGVTSGTFSEMESYFMQKYQIRTQITPAPIFSVAAGTLNGPTQVAIATENNAQCFFTTDGTTPTTSSTLYTSPVNIAYTQTLQAIAVGRSQSNVTSAAYTLNSTVWPAPNASDTTPLQIQLQLPTNSQ